MLKRKAVINLTILLTFCIGCSSALRSSSKKSTNESQSQEKKSEVTSAIKSVVQSLSQEEMSPEDLKGLTKQIREDKETQTAVQSISEAMQGGQDFVKYCPIDGQRFHSKFETCPTHNVLLQAIENSEDSDK